MLKINNRKRKLSNKLKDVSIVRLIKRKPKEEAELLKAKISKERIKAGEVNNQRTLRKRDQARLPEDMERKAESDR